MIGVGDQSHDTHAPSRGRIASFQLSSKRDGKSAADDGDDVMIVYYSSLLELA